MLIGTPPVGSLDDEKEGCIRFGGPFYRRQLMEEGRGGNPETSRNASCLLYRRIGNR